MSEHPKYEQAGDSLPPGLEYKPEYWEAALGQIEARERFLLWRKFGMAAFGILLLLFSSGSWYYLMDSEGYQIAELRTVDLHKSVENTSSENVDFYTVNSTIEERHVSVHENVSSTADPNEDDRAEDLARSNQKSSESDLENTRVRNDNKIVNNISKVSVGNDLTEAEAISGEVRQEIDEPTLSESFAVIEENRIMLSGEDQEEFQQPIPLGGIATTSEDTTVLHFLRRNASASNLLTEFNHQKELGNIKLEKILVSSIETHPAEYLEPRGMSMDIKPYGLSLPLKEFNIQLLAGSSFITHYGSRTKDKQMNPMIGVGVDYNMTKRWSFNTNVHYFSVKEIMRPYESVQTDYDFIFRTTTTTVETNKLHYLSLPVNLAYRIGERHQFSVGAGASLLVQGDNLISVEQKDNFTKSLLDEYSTKGYIKGFETINTYLNFGYNVYLNGNITAGITYQYGLTDVTKDDYFNADDKDQNTRLSATLRFNIY